MLRRMPCVSYSANGRTLAFGASFGDRGVAHKRIEVIDPRMNRWNDANGFKFGRKENPEPKKNRAVAPAGSLPLLPFAVMVTTVMVADRHGPLWGCTE